MPEGDTVWLHAKRLRDAIGGQTLRRTDFRVPRHATADLRGRTVVDVVSRGKHILTRLDDGVTLHTHFEMDGTWRLHRPGQRWAGGAAHQVRVVLTTDEWVAVGYRLPVVDLLPTVDEPSVVGHLGPDLLGPDWDLDEAVRRTASSPRREIGPALLDQRNLAGIGNLYKAEVLFLRGVHPWTRVSDVADLPAMLALSQRLLDANKHRWAQITTGDARPGRNHWVFERENERCRRCGTPIRHEVQTEPAQPTMGRKTYWCPHCQPAPD